MKVRLLSGTWAGQVVDLPRVEAEIALSTGYGEAVFPGEAEQDFVEPMAGSPKKPKKPPKAGEDD